MNVSPSENPGKPKMRLYVNVDHVATIRQARRTDQPDPVEAATLCERAGADGITVHLREDRRHIQDHDVRSLAKSVTTVLNLELASAPDIVRLAAELKPHQATFVPERRDEVTTEGGLDLGAPGRSDPRLVDAIQQLTAAGIRVSLFVNPDPAVLDAAAALGVPAVELHTGDFANSFPNAEAALKRLARATQHARAAGIAVHAGHGLNYRNVRAVAALRDVAELNIGHSIVSRAVTVGIGKAVEEMRAAINAARVD
jgi:pyridoxine 5-phosphate synthase